MIDFLIKIMETDSTSGTEEKLACYIADNFKPEGAVSELQEIPNGKKNVFFIWGNPEIIFCSHLDTVPPYIPPNIEGNIIKGRGSCDAKGQIAVMYETCRQLHMEGKTDFGLLILAGEEVGSYGAQTANKLIKGCKYVVVGEPTDNKLIRAGKGNLMTEVEIKGKASHSGYPDNGDDAVERLRVFLNKLKNINFPEDDILGRTTYNIGMLEAPNAHNVVPDAVKFRMFFRTTFKTHNLVKDALEKISDDKTNLNFVYGDEPIHFYTVEGFESGIVSYGSDAPMLGNLGKRLLYGPGSILTAHTENEHVKISDLNRAVVDLKNLYYKLSEEKQ